MTIKTKKIIGIGSLLLSTILLFSIIFSLATLKPTFGVSRLLDLDTLNIFGLNNILFYDPNGGCFSNSSNRWNGTELTFDDLDAVSKTDWRSRLKLIVETYGELAMQLQELYGVPWEVPFAHFVKESSVGMSGGINGEVKAAGKYNMMGMKYRPTNTLATECYSGWACYETMSDMIIAWAVSFMRNGLYDAAFAYLDPNNYDLDSFISTMIYVYAPPSENDTEGYIRDAKGYIKDVVEKVRLEKGWPTSAELAKQKNIPIGGKYPLKTTLKKIFEDIKSGEVSFGGSGSASSSRAGTTASASTLHAPSGDGWLSGLAGWEKKELSQNAGGCTHYDSSISNGYIPASGGGTGLPQYIVLHYTEGSSLASYCDFNPETGKGSRAVVPPHFTIDLVNKKIYQHFPLTSPSGAVSGGEGDWDRWGVQIEIMGCGFMSSYREPCSSQYDLRQFTDEQWDYLGALLVEIAKQTGIPLESSLDWSKEKRLTTSEMKSYIGVLGHQHVQGNDHSDPGPIWDKVKAAIDRNPDYSVGCSDGSTSSGAKYCAEGEECTSDGFTVYSQGDPRWNDDNAGKWRTMSEDGCGPNSFATAATNLLHKKITPKEVSDYMCSSGLTCEGPTGWGDATKLAEHYGIESKELTANNATDWKKIIDEHLKSGWIIHAVGAGGEPWRFGGTTNGHYIIIRGITPDGKWKIANNTFQQNNQDWDPQPIVDGIIKNGGGGITALRSTNSGTCISTCSVSSDSTGQLSAGGFKTEEEANQAIMQPYHGLYKDGRFDSATMSQYGIVPTETCAAGPPYNCVSFVYYFLNKYTNLSNSVIKDLGVDGYGTAKAVAEKFNLKNDSTPEVYSIFSWSNGGAGHTGVVLGIIDDNHILVGESSCSSITHGGTKEKAIKNTGAHIYEKVKDGQWSGALTSSATDWNFTHIPTSNIKGI